MILKNVVIINDFNYSQGGASNIAVQTAQLLKEKGINVIFFSALNNNEEKEDGIEYIYTNQDETLKDLNKIRGFFNGIYNVKAKKMLKKLLKRLDNNDTIVHIHGWTKALSSSVFDIAFKMNFKVVLTFHEYFSICPNGAFFDYRKNKACTKKCFSKECYFCDCDSRNILFKMYRLIRFFFQSYVVKVNKKLKYGISISNKSGKIIAPYFSNDILIKLIYNPIDVLEIDDDSEKRINEEYYLYVGRVDKEKGIDDFCEVITELDKSGVVVGDGKEREQLEKKYPNISFVGWKKRNEVYKYMKNAESVIVPSIWYESAGLTILESQFVGTPCIVSSFCSGEEFIKIGYTYKDLNDLKRCICNKMYYKETSLTLEKFKPNVYTNEIISFFNSILN